MMKNPIVSTFHEWLDNSGSSVLTVESYVSDVKKYRLLKEYEMEGSVTISLYLWNCFKEHLQANN